MYIKLITFRWKIWLAFSFVRPVHHKRSKPTKAGSDLIYKKQMKHLRENLKTDSGKVKILTKKKKSTPKQHHYFLHLLRAVKTAVMYIEDA